MYRLGSVRRFQSVKPGFTNGLVDHGGPRFKNFESASYKVCRRAAAVRCSDGKIPFAFVQQSDDKRARFCPAADS